MIRISTKGTARVRHRSSGKIFEVSADEIDWEPQSSHERDMGKEVLWGAVVDHPELGELRWDFSEYPEGFVNDVGFEAGEHEVLANFNVSIDFDPDPEPGDDLDDEEERERIIDELRDWFFKNYEDPANSLPYISAEGGYQWINGGPFTPQEVLGENFESEYGYELIEEVAKRITDETGIWDWTPVLGPDFYGDDEKSQLDPESDSRLDILKQAENLSRRLPLSEELINDPSTGKFDVRPCALAKPDLINPLLGQIDDAIEDILSNPTNGLNEKSLEIRRLRRVVARYANDPQRIEMDLTSIHASVTQKIASGELPPSDENEALLRALQEGAQGIRASHPDVAENRSILREQALRELTTEELDAVSAAAPVLEAITEGDLRQQFHDDIRYLSEEAKSGPRKLPGVTRKDAILQGRDEAVRLFGRSARMLVILRRAPELVHKIHETSGFKAMNIIAVLGTLVTIGIALL